MHRSYWSSRAMVIAAFFGLVILAATGCQANTKAEQSPSPLVTVHSAITSSVSPVPSASPTGEVSSTPSPPPTLAPEAAAAELVELLEHNSGCLLPCWWGATPGQTDWAEVESMLAALDAQIDNYAPGAYEVFLPHVPEGMHTHYRGFHLYYLTQGDVVRSIKVGAADMSAYNLSRILQGYEVPTEVGIDTMSAPREGSLPFRLVLTYAEQGFAVQLHDDAEVIDGMVAGCFPDDDDQAPTLYLWSAGEPLTFEEIIHNSGFGESNLYLPLDEATDLDVSSFYEKYKQSGGTACVLTPADLWNF